MECARTAARPLKWHVTDNYNFACTRRIAHALHPQTLLYAVMQYYVYRLCNLTHAKDAIINRSLCHHLMLTLCALSTLCSPWLGDWVRNRSCRVNWCMRKITETFSNRHLDRNKSAVSLHLFSFSFLCFHSCTFGSLGFGCCCLMLFFHLLRYIEYVTECGEHIPYSRVGVCVCFEIEHGMNMKPVQSTENK